MIGSDIYSKDEFEKLKSRDIKTNGIELIFHTEAQAQAELSRLQEHFKVDEKTSVALMSTRTLLLATLNDVTYAQHGEPVNMGDTQTMPFLGIRGSAPLNFKENELVDVILNGKSQIHTHSPDIM